MGRTGCTVDGNLNVSKFNEPMPWIGVYVAAASSFCALGMAIDAFHGFRYKKFWFPCKFFSLNATTLTIIAVAIKFSVDLNTSMPHRQDQLAKVSSSAFICTVIGNFLPSLGTMDNTELLMNLMALVILVITAIVNICIQLGTGVIFVFFIEHAFIMLLMLVLLAILSSSALAIPTIKYYLDLKYGKKLEMAIKECSEKRDASVAVRLREDLMKYWMMAHTSSPQFVIGRSATCTASGAFCLLGAVTLAEVMLRSYLMPWSFKFCVGQSDYKWSTTLVLITQTIAVGVGTISPAFRWFMAINFRCPKKANKARKREFRVENYWIRKLLEWKEYPLYVRVFGRRGRKLVQDAKTQLLAFCIGMQKGIVMACKLIRLSSIFLVSRFLKLKGLIECNISVSSNESELESQHNPNMKNLSRFVMHLEGEEELVDLMMENNWGVTDHWIRMGKKEEPRYLIQLLEKSNSSVSFKGIREFDSDKVPSLESAEPPNSWALPVVTLTSIAISLPNIERHLIKQLVSSVHEGLMYVREVENNLDEKRDLKNVRKAAEVVWLEVELYSKWLDVDLREMALQGKSGKEIIGGLSDIAKRRFMEFGKGDMIHANECLREIPSRWPIKVLAANSMYRICQTILLGLESSEYECSQKLFEKLSFMISHILRASFTNLQHVISKQCHRSRIEEREQSIRYAILLFGKTETILKILDQQKHQDSDPDQLAHIDDWDLLCKQKEPRHSTSSFADRETAFSSPPDLHIYIV